MKRVRDNKTGHFAEKERAKTDKDNVTVETVKPIGVILFCPVCKEQHIDAPEPDKGWMNPPHKSHLCAHCGVIWRPSEHPTYGVAVINNFGKNDTWFGEA